MVLAAGASRRMGHPKALLRLAPEGPTFLARVVQALLEGGVTSVCVVFGGVHGVLVRAHAEQLATTRGWPLATIENPAPEPGGPISSVGVAVAELPVTCKGVLVHPVDIPGLAAADVAALIACARARPQVAAVVPVVAGRGAHPVFLAARFLTRVRARAPDATLRTLLACEPQVVRLPLENALLRLDVDTPDQLAAWPQRP